MPSRFLRPALAEQLATRLLDQDSLNRGTDLFLAAPRRTGKSSFLQQELIPVLDRKGAMTVYCDLWERRNADPGTVVAEAIGRSLEATDALPKKAVHFARETTGLGKASIFGVGGAEVDATPPQAPAIDNLRKLISRLNDGLAYRPVVLIVDEAQHAVTTENGLATMFSLKSARDQFNADPDAPMFFLVLTGSNQTKLSELIVKRNAAFYGGRVDIFPRLDNKFVHWFVDDINRLLAAEQQVALDDAERAFAEVGARPETFMAIMRDYALSAADARPALSELARAANRGEWLEFDQKYETLSRLQRAILTTMIEGRDGNFYHKAAHADYRRILQTTELFPSYEIQAALKRLIELELVWNTSYGGYALEDDAIKLWWRQRGS